MSFFRIDSGTVQVGLRLTAVMLRGQRRRRAIDLADHRDVAPRDLAVLDRLGDRGRNVHHHVALAEGEAHARAAGRARPRAGGCASCTGTFSASMVCGPTVPVSGRPWRDLEALHRLGQHRVVGVALGDLDGQVLGDGEARAQRCDVRPRRAGLEIDLGDLRPAAAHVQRRIGEHRGVDAVVGAFVEGRLGRGPEARDRRASRVSAAAEGFAWALALLREGGRGREAKRGGEQNRAEHGALPVNPTRTAPDGSSVAKPWRREAPPSGR